MSWDIKPFIGVRPIRFGMKTQEVAAILGPPVTSRRRGTSVREQRLGAPKIIYRDQIVSEIELFMDLPDVTFRGVNVFEQDSKLLLQFLETASGRCVHGVGILLFENIGISAGRIDEDLKEQHSVVAFRKGLWDDAKEGMEPISFF